jgi:hypothetical protein
MTINHEGTWKDEDSFEAYKKGESVSFDRDFMDGGFRIAIDGYQVKTFHMNAAAVYSVQTVDHGELR